MQVGDSGRYQRRICLNSLIVLFTASFTVYSLNYLLPSPDPYCLYESFFRFDIYYFNWYTRVEGSVPSKYESCSEKKACSLIKTDPNLAEIRWIYPNNWTEHYQIFCDKANERDLAKTIALLEITIVNLVLLGLADIIGRKKILLTASVLILIGMNLLVFCESLLVKMLGMGLASGAEGSFSALFSILINETTG